MPLYNENVLLASPHRREALLAPIAPCVHSPSVLPRSLLCQQRQYTTAAAAEISQLCWCRLAPNLDLEWALICASFRSDIPLQVSSQTGSCNSPATLASLLHRKREHQTSNTGRLVLHDPCFTNPMHLPDKYMTLLCVGTAGYNSSTAPGLDCTTSSCRQHLACC